MGTYSIDQPRNRAIEGCKVGRVDSTRYLDGQEHFHLSKRQFGTLGIKPYFKCLRLAVWQVLHSVQFNSETWPQTTELLSA